MSCFASLGRTESPPVTLGRRHSAVISPRHRVDEAVTTNEHQVNRRTFHPPGSFHQTAKSRNIRHRNENLIARLYLIAGGQHRCPGPGLEHHRGAVGRYRSIEKFGVLQPDHNRVYGLPRRGMPPERLVPPDGRPIVLRHAPPAHLNEPHQQLRRTSAGVCSLACDGSA